MTENALHPLKVAVTSGRVFAWASLDQAVAGAVLMSVFFLMYRRARASA